VHLLLELPRHRHERPVREVGEPEPGVERALVVGRAARLAVLRTLVRRRRQREVPDPERVLGRADGLVVRVDRDRPVAVRMAVGRDARRPVDGPDARPRVRGEGGGVEGWVLDVVAHADDAALAVRFDVHERAAVVQPELAVVLVDDLVGDAHVLVHEADVELERLHDRSHVVAFDAHQAPHAGRVRGARAQPLVDGDVVDHVDAGPQRDLRHQGPVNEVADHHVLEHDRDEPGAGQLTQRGRRVPHVE
jgi:hypothetical protein